MAYHTEKTQGGQDLVIDGFEYGIAVSPHKGIGNMQGVDISTETDEVMVSYARTQQSQYAISGGTLTPQGSNALGATGGTPAGHQPVAGSWINVSASTISGLSTGNYFIYSSAAGTIQISSAYDPTGSNIVSGFGMTGSATYSTAFNLGQAVQSATEFYTDTSHVLQNRYYILDANGRLWVYDTALTSLWNWFLPYTTATTTPALGLGFLNGTIFIFGSNIIYTLSSSQLGTAPSLFAIATAMTGVTGSTDTHFAFSGHQGTLYYTDGNFVGSIFPDTSIDPDLPGPIPNIQSYGSYTGASTTGTITTIFSGSVPATQTYSSTARIPAFFFAATGGTTPSALTPGTKYYIDYSPGLSSSGHFEVYAASSGGSALNLASGATGTQYFNTFFTQSSDGLETLLFNQTRVTLPVFETAISLAEIGNLIIIGTKGNTLYPWNQVDPTPSGLISLPENNATSLLTVNNMCYIFAGSRGNIYITNGSTASLVTTLPDYCSGLVEPYFVWGGVMYLRGRVWFSIQDQTASHTGNCGGIWSFVPPQNFFIGQDTGLSLRMDNRPTDGTYNGMSTVLIPAQNQSARGPQYWDARTSSVTSPLYSINFSSTLTSASTPAVIETDLIPTGTLLDKKTFQQIEFKLAASTDAVNAETVAIGYRNNLTDAFAPLGSAITEPSSGLGYISGYFVANFEKTQWLQFQITLTTSGTSNSSFVRLIEVRAR